MIVRNCKGNAPAKVKDGEFYIYHSLHVGNPFPWEVRRKVPGGFDYINAARTEQHARMIALAASLNGEG